MKTFIAMLTLFLLLGFTNVSYSQSQPWKEVGSFVESTTTRMMKYVGQGDSDQGQADWKLSAVWLRIQAQFGIEVPWLAALRIVPEVEMVFEED